MKKGSGIIKFDFLNISVNAPLQKYCKILDSYSEVAEDCLMV